MRSKLAAAVGATLVSLGLGAVAQASLLVDFKPQPASSNYYETSWNGNNLLVTPAGPVAEPGMFGGGAVGNDDGGMPIAQQTMGGLQISTPVKVTGVAGSFNDVGTGFTTFYDVTLKLTAMGSGDVAKSESVTPGITVLSQPIGRGTFELWSTGAAGQQELLLTGAVTDMVVVGIEKGGTASVQSTTVNYTGGAIMNALGLKTLQGSLSWSLLDVNNGGLKIATGGNIAPFDANMTGLFSAVPEPGSLSVLGLGALGLIRRRRK